MNLNLTYTLSVIMSAASLLVMIANFILIDSNRHLQEQANQRQTEINNAQSLAPLNNNLIQALGEVAYKNNDTAVKDLLAAQGFTLKPQGQAATGGESAPARAPKEKEAPAAKAPATAPAPAAAPAK